MASLPPHLPLEVHRTIAQYIGNNDLPYYRLADKSLCAIGTEELFHTICFHYSSASLARIIAISDSPGLRKYVRTIVWDTDVWKILDIRDLHK